MINEAEIWEMEQNFWLADAAYFTQKLAEGCIMVFPQPAEILVGAAIVQWLKGAPRWDTVDMTDRKWTHDEVGAVTIAYKAKADRQGKPYSALCSSTYVGQNGNWKLMQHQQTPL